MSEFFFWIFVLDLRLQQFGGWRIGMHDVIKTLLCEESLNEIILDTRVLDEI
jgi:hypothetical protein